MRRALVFVVLVLTVRTSGASEDFWNQFRGPDGNGLAQATELPVEFDEQKNVKWKTLIAGDGWSSPVVWGDDVWLTVGSDESRELRAICLSLSTGVVRKEIKVFDMLERQIDPNYKHDSPHLNSPATPTPVVEEDRVYVSFGSQGLACLDRESGEKLWERRDLRVYQPVRQGSSPIVDQESLYVAFDGTDQQFFVALNKFTGETRWKVDRNVGTDWAATLRASGFSNDKGGKPNDNKKSFATASLIEVNGQRQLIAPAAEATIAYDPATGRELWRFMHPGGFNIAARPIFANGLVYVFTSGLTGTLLGIRPGGEGDVTESHLGWKSQRGTPRIPSPIVTGGRLVMVTDKGGVVRALDAETGEEQWKLRIGGDHWASPVWANHRLYFCSKQGDVTVVDIRNDEPVVVAENRLDASFIASPAVAGDNLLLRSTTHLYCMAKGYELPATALAMKEKTQEKSAASEPDWEKAYERALKENPGLKAKVEGGKATKAQVIAWMKSQRKGSSKKQAKKDAPQAIDWDEAYEKLYKSDAGLRAKVDGGDVTREEVIAWLKRQSGKGGGKGKNAKGKAGAMAEGEVGFYAVAIGRLKSKDIELGEFTFEVDHVTSMYDNRWVKDQVVGKTVTVTGVSGAFLDNLLQIKRGETLKVRTGSYIQKSQTLKFGMKFHVLERTPPFDAATYGIPPEDFRGFQGELVGTIVEAAGYEMLLHVEGVTAAGSSEAKDPSSIKGRRVRINGFYQRHERAFNELHEDDRVRVSVAHRNASHDELAVTETLEKIEN